MEPATDGRQSASSIGLLLLAHGEGLRHADNAGAFRLKADLTECGIAAEIRLGFINGTPTIADALGAFQASHIVVYPLLMSAGFLAEKGFRILRDAQAATGRKRTLEILPVLGLEPALADVIAARASSAARALAVTPSESILVLMAHGSKRGSASEAATEMLAKRLARCGSFGDVRTAYLEQAPSLSEALATSRAPAVVVGLFAGEGLHGGTDVVRMIAEAGRSDIAFAGNAGSWPEIAKIVVCAVERASKLASARGGAPVRRAQVGDPAKGLRPPVVGNTR
jgi:sirohydrochlorin ferrochelatase